MSDPTIEPSPDAPRVEEPTDWGWAVTGQVMLWAKTINVLANRHERKRLAQELLLLADRCEGPEFSTEAQMAAEGLIRPAAGLLEIDRE